MSFRGSSLAVLTALVFALAACGDDNDNGGSSSTAPAGKKNAKIAAEVPSAIRSKGTLKVAADATYPPNEFIRPGSKAVVGMDADLAKELGRVMGLKLQVVNATFDAIIPGLAAGKYDIGMSSFTDTKEREKTVDFVTYLIAGTEFYVKADGGPTVNTLADLCGQKVGVEKGTTQQDDVTAQSKKCKSAGKPAVNLQVYPDQNGVNSALSSGRVEVGMADSPVADYIVKQSNGQFKVVGKTYGTAPYGVALPKGNGMARPVRDAMKLLVDDGTYSAVLARWGIKHFAIKDPKINDAAS
jgi:polar amino acid transport system substrate-binding protein